MVLDNSEEEDAQLRWEIGLRLRALREEMKLSQEAMAEKLGTNRASYRNYEAGRLFTKPTFVLTLCSHFNVDPNWLFLGDYKKIDGDTAIKLQDRVRSYPQTPSGAAVLGRPSNRFKG